MKGPAIEIAVLRGQAPRLLHYHLRRLAPRPLFLRPARAFSPLPAPLEIPRTRALIQARGERDVFHPLSPWPIHALSRSRTRLPSRYPVRPGQFSFEIQQPFDEELGVQKPLGQVSGEPCREYVPRVGVPSGQRLRQTRRPSGDTQFPPYDKGPDVESIHHPKTLEP